jgi:hypothetical protein
MLVLGKVNVTEGPSSRIGRSKTRKTDSESINSGAIELYKYCYQMDEHLVILKVKRFTSFLSY